MSRIGPAVRTGGLCLREMPPTSSPIVLYVIVINVFRLPWGLAIAFSGILVYRFFATTHRVVIDNRGKRCALVATVPPGPSPECQPSPDRGAFPRRR